MIFFDEILKKDWVSPLTYRSRSIIVRCFELVTELQYTVSSVELVHDARTRFSGTSSEGTSHACVTHAIANYIR